MNLADYLSELLGQYEEVSVPGLGYFVRERVNGYYNDNEARFYPPHHKVKFVPQPKDDDDTFTQYVADKKNISLASSKYFAEKFVSKLREEASTGKYLFADLGLFYTDKDQLVFKPNDKIADDPAFYGYPPINIYKQGQSLNDQYSKPSFTDPGPAPVLITKPMPAQANENDQYFEEETERKKPINIWLIILIAVSVIALAIFGVYKFYPGAFDKLGATYNRITGKKDTVVPVYRREVKADSVKKAIPAPVKDTAIKTVPPATNPVVTTAADTTKHTRYEIIVSNFRQINYANTEVQRLKARGVDAKIVTDAPGPRLKISVGTFPTEIDADGAMKVLEKAGKINKKSYILAINP
ncbi:SPOR domain-containing protein [Mucilaginibacter sp. OK098]|uniref:HU domain-containing protein n=1 Tax=Mucilaginibacter sp. OK098 TaxID=1855297 RepID=UPI000916FFAE|nr:SPOR domain-containing protein [Mucilaginibacter sp. OK098]SHN09203.1 Sporulation related domain-containing protein [Mucilaginibacter sp. OK098]